MEPAKKKTRSFGGCNARVVRPRSAKLSPNTKVVSFMFTFQEALKLNLSISEGVRWMNRFDQGKEDGKRAALVVNFKPGSGRTYVLKGRMPKKSGSLTKSKAGSGANL